MDVDGTLTDGTITYSDDGTELRSFHARDGLGIKLLPRAGLVPAIVSGRDSAAVRRRARELGIHEVHQAVGDKVAVVEALCERLGLAPEEVAFVGDDLADLAVMQKAAWSAAPSDADPAVLEVATYVCRAPGGRGAVREAVEALLGAMGRWAPLVESLRSLPTEGGARA
jgi:3-deoxy-D-manno-octulosonate 8-phosphate phosphatase (KDO 8-P phosphatase)